MNSGVEVERTEPIGRLSPALPMQCSARASRGTHRGPHIAVTILDVMLRRVYVAGSSRSITLCTKETVAS